MISLKISEVALCFIVRVITDFILVFNENAKLHCADESYLARQYNFSSIFIALVLLDKLKLQKGQRQRETHHRFALANISFSQPADKPTPCLGWILEKVNYGRSKELDQIIKVQC